jgi:tetratricopeptide (TPR) repeat protein
VSRLYEALTAIGRTAPRVLARVDLPATVPRLSRRTGRRQLVTLCGILVVLAGGTLAALRYGPSATPRLSPPNARTIPAVQTAQPVAIQALPPVRGRETLEGPELRERALQAAALGSLEQAEQLLERALALNRNDALMWNDLGVVLVRRGERRRGIEAFQRGLALDSRHAGTHRNLAVALDQDGQVRMAATHYRAVLALAPQHPERVQIERRLAFSVDVEAQP